MAAAATVQPTLPSPQTVASVFVQQYYELLSQSPNLVHRFYHDISVLGRPEEDGTMSMTTTLDEIDSKILSLNYGEVRTEIKTIDAQESWNGGVGVLVIGLLTGKDNVQRKFTQSFFLAPQDKGYFVLNDMFRYVDNHNEGHIAPTEDAEALVIPEQVAKSVPELENQTAVEVAVTTEEPQVEVVSNLPEKVEEAVEEEEEPVAEVVDEVPEPSQLIVESNTKIEEVPKKSYASIVQALKQNASPFSSPVPAQRKVQPRKQEQQVKNVPPTASPIEAASSNVDAVENGIHEEEDGYSIYIRGLPMSATPAMLDDEFKKFGTVKPNGIQVRSNRGFCFGFVEFEAHEAVKKAIEASPVDIGGCSVDVEEKRSTNSKGGRLRFPAGRGAGFRNEGLRGRGNFGSGGRGFNRGGDFGDRRNDFGGNRNEYGSRGGGRGRGGATSNRGNGGDGYQRERVNRGVAVNGTAKNMAPRVPATA